MPKKKYDEALKDLVVDARRRGLTRRVIALDFGIPESAVKTILRERDVVIPMDLRQSNAYQVKLAKDPDAMKRMRLRLTPDVLAGRSDSIRATYGQRPDLAVAASQRMRQFFIENPKPRKYGWDHVLQAAEASGIKITSNMSAPWGSDELLDAVCVCGVSFQPNVHDFIYGKIRSCGCVKSFQEKRILKIIQDWGFEAYSDRSEIAPYELDIFIPKLRLAIEYCGLWAHGELLFGSAARRRHLDKVLRCRDVGIRLITIFSDEWFSRNEAVVGYLRSVLGVDLRKVGARECVLDSCSSELTDFLDRYHVMGAGGRYRSVEGLLFEGALIAVMAFRGKELARYCVAPGVKLVGGFQKLLASHLKANPSLQEIVTFSDNRWSEGDLYLRNGFRHAADVAPSYWYTKKACDTKRWHKSNFRKEKIPGIQPTETEWQAMQRLGYDRVWDCGLKRWTLDLPRPSNGKAPSPDLGSNLGRESM